MTKRLPQIGLIALMSLLVLSWSTCPSLYVNSVRSLMGVDVHACAGDPAEAHCPFCEQQQPCPSEDDAPERCPLCEKIGSMHALVTLDAPASLEAPDLVLHEVVAAAMREPSDRTVERLEPDFSPPDEQFTTTVRFLC